MSTGIETWNINLAEVGALYPFAGYEAPLVGAAVIAWIAWHVVQMKSEGEQISRLNAKEEKREVAQENNEANETELRP